MIKVIDYTKNPLTLMGTVASYCWDSTPSPQIGIDCIESGHGRVLEYPDVTIEISEYSIKVIRQLYTHIIGVSRLERSTRYVDCTDFDFVIPNTIKNNPLALEEYISCMKKIKETYLALRQYDIPKEDVSNILPSGMNTKVVLKINARAILHIAELRLCNRAYWEFRNLIKELIEVVSGLDDEWEKIMNYAKPKCEIYGYCSEKTSCYKFPKKNN